MRHDEGRGLCRVVPSRPVGRAKHVLENTFSVAGGWQVPAVRGLAGLEGAAGQRQSG